MAFVRRVLIGEVEKCEKGLLVLVMGVVVVPRYSRQTLWGKIGNRDSREYAVGLGLCWDCWDCVRWRVWFEDQWHLKEASYFVLVVYI